MEKQPLEKVLEKLEKLDIREWRYKYDSRANKNVLITETGGLRFIIKKEGYKENILSYLLHIGHIEPDFCSTDTCIAYFYDKKNKPQRELLGNFYEKTLSSLKEGHKKKLEEKFEFFMLD